MIAEIFTLGEIFVCMDCGGSPIESFGRCASCNAARRKAERQPTKVQVLKPIKKVSERMAEDLKKYPKLKKNFLLHKMECEFKFPGCLNLASQIHHCSISAKNFLNTDTWMSSCA